MCFRHKRLVSVFVYLTTQKTQNFRQPVQTFALHKEVEDRKERYYLSFSYLSLLVKLINGFASLFPCDSLLPLPDGVHVTVVHTLAGQLLLELEGARGRVLAGVSGPAVLAASVMSVTAIAAITATAPDIPPFSDTAELVSPVRLLQWNMLRAAGHVTCDNWVNRTEIKLGGSKMLKFAKAFTLPSHYHKQN